MRLCSVDEVKRLNSLEVEIEIEGKVTEGFVVYRDGEVTAFLNRCPHTGAPLNWSPHVFLSPEGGHIQCSIHGALFRTSDGYCEFGPCAGESLAALPVGLRDGQIVLLDASVPLPSK